MQKTTPPVHWIADLALLRTLLAICQKSKDPNFWKVMDSFVLLAYASLAASRKPVWLYFRFKRFILLVQTNSTSSWKPWRGVRLDLILLMRDIYINSKLNPLIKFTSMSTEFKDILPWNISKFPIKFPDVNLEYDGKTGNNSTWSLFLNNMKRLWFLVSVSMKS